jgi:hypothetical protein
VLIDHEALAEMDLELETAEARQEDRDSPAVRLVDAAWYGRTGVAVEAGVVVLRPRFVGARGSVTGRDRQPRTVADREEAIRVVTALWGGAS